MCNGTIRTHHFGAVSTTLYMVVLTFITCILAYYLHKCVLVLPGIVVRMAQSHYCQLCLPMVESAPVWPTLPTVCVETLTFDTFVHACTRLWHFLKVFPQADTFLKHSSHFYHQHYRSTANCSAVNCGIDTTGRDPPFSQSLLLLRPDAYIQLHQIQHFLLKFYDVPA